MNFVSYEFVLALAVIFVLYYIIPKKFQWIFLLAVSFIFYSTAGLSGVIYITINIVVTYVCAVGIDKLNLRYKQFLQDEKDTKQKQERKVYKNKIKNKQKAWLVFAIFVNVGLLVLFKCSGTIEPVFQGLLNIEGDIIVPLGISFYTLQSVGYLFDVYNEKVICEKNIAKFALFIAFFPQVIIGPISKFEDLSMQLWEKHYYSSKNVSYGLSRILWGYFKKLVIADRVVVGLNCLIGNPQMYNGVYYAVAVLFYALQLYADFTGGIDIVIGIAQVLGIKLKENFKRPFFARNIKDYWNRWHISMGVWFTDYVFYPVCVCKPMINISKFAKKHMGEKVGKKISVYLSTIIVWTLTGLWHGAALNFLVWGFANCAVILISQECIPLYRKFHNRFNVKGKTWYEAFCVVRTFLLMSSIRMFDCYTDVTTTLKQFVSIFTVRNINVLWDGSLCKIGLDVYDYIIIFAGVIFMVIVSVLGQKKSVRDRVSQLKYPVRVIVWLGLAVTVILFGVYGQGYEATDFIYSRF